ncbi:MAG TPA: ligase-associated DNA damage response exonuclease [Ferrovibrio sp.]|jgi:putative mRNA 3-end processing factor|uniref:ligase-associated DNA damage response exonuclease n=1 Tax=Ferrovibrio sp. TaxID=1917215 RepID=UPI002B4B2FD2|nr:ligase-associated DNA damage response exonuclease [Ferrovibrio sp.]HLT77602.1 ligase-associated DNA damage response exonuclease [Ferrovibrio sp.]
MASTIPRPETWLKPTPRGLYVEPGDFYIDPTGGADRAVITHGHADHARPGHGRVLATPGTLAIMRARYGENAGRQQQALDYGERLDINGVSLCFKPAGHVLGSAQAVLEWRGSRVVVSGDYKRRRDPTCPPFEVTPCDVFVTEATFGLPVFRHPDDAGEIARLLHSVRLFPERAHLVGVYALGKAQRVIMLLREAGWDGPIWLHGALVALCDLYRDQGVALGDLRHVGDTPKAELRGAIVLAPPSAIEDRWSRRLPDPVTCAASGWLRIKQRARQGGLELPLVISDHADWDELNATIDEVGAPEVWVTHGREEALMHAASQRGIRARALRLIGYEDEDPS